MLEGVRERLSRPWVMWLVLATFVMAGVLRFRDETSEDLASSYVGCRLVATGHTGVLYSYDSDNFANVGDLTGTWQRLGDEGGFHGYLHPYVQTPLWAYMLQPLCDHTHFKAFQHTFLVLTMLALAATVWLVARFWTPSLFHPVALALIFLCLFYAQPFRYAMFLLQTHALFFFLTVAALMLAERDRPVLAGLLMAYAASVKVTPGVIVIYWLLTRRWKAAASTIAWSIALLVVTWLAVGPHLLATYLACLQRVSRVLLVAQNNQSFAAWVMARFYPPDEVFDINVLPLPTPLRLGSLALMAVCTAAGGLLDRWRGDRLRPDGVKATPPIGAMIALLAVTIFAPIAWTHYWIILVAPAMVLLEESRRLHSWWVVALVAVIIVLNYPPLATDVLHMDISDYAIVRGQFFAGALAMGALGLCGWMSRGQRTSAVA